MGFKPLHDWALIRRDEPEEKTSGGIIIPDTAKDKPAQGVVLAVGPGKFVKEKGKKEKKFVATVLQPGQRVMFIDYMAKDVEVGSETVTLIREDDILGTVEGRGALAVKPHYHLEAKEDRPPMVKSETEKKAAAPAIAAGKMKASTSGKAVERTLLKKKAPLKTAKEAGKKATAKKAAPATAKTKTKAKVKAKITAKTAKPAAKKQAAKKTTPAKAKVKAKTTKPAVKKSTPKKPVAKAGLKKKVAKKVTKKTQKSKARPKR